MHVYVCVCLCMCVCCVVVVVIDYSVYFSRLYLQSYQALFTDRTFDSIINDSVIVTSINLCVSFLAAILIVFSKPIIDTFGTFNRLGTARNYSRF